MDVSAALVLTSVASLGGMLAVLPAAAPFVVPSSAAATRQAASLAAGALASALVAAASLASLVTPERRRRQSVVVLAFGALTAAAVALQPVPKVSLSETVFSLYLSREVTVPVFVHTLVWLIAVAWKYSGLAPCVQLALLGWCALRMLLLRGGGTRDGAEAGGAGERSVTSPRVRTATLMLLLLLAALMSFAGALWLFPALAFVSVDRVLPAVMFALCPVAWLGASVCAVLAAGTPARTPRQSTFTSVALVFSLSGLTLVGACLREEGVVCGGAETRLFCFELLSCFELCLSTQKKRQANNHRLTKA